jgi:beta-galactosidase GanA
MTHIEIYMNWARLEPERDQWNMQEFDDMLRLSQQHGLKILAFPNVNNTPDWLKQTAGFQPVVNMRTGDTYHFPSPWAPRRKYRRT